MKLSNLLEEASETVSKATKVAMLAAPLLAGGCAERQTVYNFPNMQGSLPNTPGAVIDATQGAIACVQNPPDVTVDTATAAKSCLLGGDLPAQATCGGYQMQAICHNPSYNSGFACVGVNSVTCDGVSVIGQRGPVTINSGRVPVRVTVPRSTAPQQPSSPWAIPGLPAAPQGLPGLGQNFPFPSF